MPHIASADGVKLYYEEAGSGTPIVFVHEFAGDHRSWEPQLRHFARRYRCNSTDHVLLKNRLLFLGQSVERFIVTR